MNFSRNTKTLKEGFFFLGQFENRKKEVFRIEKVVFGSLKEFSYKYFTILGGLCLKIPG